MSSRRPPQGNGRSGTSPARSSTRPLRASPIARSPSTRRVQGPDRPDRHKDQEGATVKDARRMLARSASSLLLRTLVRPRRQATSPSARGPCREGPMAVVGAVLAHLERLPRLQHRQRRRRFLERRPARQGHLGRDRLLRDPRRGGGGVREPRRAGSDGAARPGKRLLRAAHTRLHVPLRRVGTRHRHDPERSLDCRGDFRGKLSAAAVLFGSESAAHEYARRFGS